MIITQIQIKAFKSFDDFALDLKPFTVLAGPNNSGKSNLLDAVLLLRDGFSEAGDRPLVNRPRGTGIELFHRADDGTTGDSFEIDVIGRLHESSVDLARLIFRSEKVDGRLVTSRGGDLKNNDVGFPPEDFDRLGRRLAGWTSVNPEAGAMRSGASLDDTYPLASSGANLAAVIGRIFEGNAVAEEFVLDAQFVISDLVDVRPVRDERRNQWDFDVVMRGGRTFTPALVSDGTLRVLALLAALHDPDHRSVVMIEDIENGLHPEYQGRLCDRLAARTANGDRQVIATTHSPVIVSAAMEQPNSAIVFLDQVAGPADEGDGVRRPQHRTRARRIAAGGERGTYVSAAELEKYLTTAGGR
jgi:predicted ATPase